MAKFALRRRGRQGKYTLRRGGRQGGGIGIPLAPSSRELSPKVTEGVAFYSFRSCRPLLLPPLRGTVSRGRARASVRKFPHNGKFPGSQAAKSPPGSLQESACSPSQREARKYTLRRRGNSFRQPCGLTPPSQREAREIYLAATREARKCGTLKAVRRRRGGTAPN